MVFTDRRKFKRIKVDCKTTLTSMGDKNEVYEVNVLDIGGGGISFSCSNDFKSGEDFIINLPTISIHAYIVWKQEDRYGAMFTHPLADQAEIIAHSICEDRDKAIKDN